MAHTIERIIKYFANEPRKLFLFDSLGALLTAVLLYSLLRPNYDLFGLSSAIFTNLALGALAICLYSLGCFVLIRKGWAPFLRTIALLNGIYCLSTVILLARHSAHITPLCWVYFLGEVGIIASLIYIEYKVASLVK